jgi:methylmalonyl-CoA mutase C-terminal domain/subunit
LKEETRMTGDEMRIRILIGKVGFDPHDRGILALSRAFRDAGMEVIFLGKFKTVAEVVSAAIDEGVDVIALSDHCGTMRLIASDVTHELNESGASDICVVAGGIIPNEDRPALEEMGVTGNYGPGTAFQDIIDHIVSRVRAERWQEPEPVKAQDTEVRP